MTPQELIDAVRPCLPLTLFDSIADGVDNAAPWVVFKHGSWCCEPMIVSMAEAVVIGAISQACDERGWSVHTMMNGVRCVTIYGPLHENDSGVRKLGEADGRGVSAWCRAYAQAKEATGG